MNLIFDKFKDKFNIKEVIEKFLAITQKGNNYWAVCPFHNDSNPSLSISTSKNIFKCFSCNESGNSITFVMKYLKISYSSSIKKICEILNIPLDKEFVNPSLLEEISKTNDLEKIFNLNEIAAKTYHENLLNNKEILLYFQKRKIPLDLIKQYNIGFCDSKNSLSKIIERWNKLNLKNLITEKTISASNLFVKNELKESYNFFSQRITFPILNLNKNIVGFSGRSINETQKIKYLNSKESIAFQKSKSLFNIQNIKKNQNLYIFEGFFDLLNSHNCSIENGVVLMGLSLSNFNIEKLKTSTSTIVLCLDNDDAGKNFTIKLGIELISQNFTVLVVDISEIEEKDIDSYIVSNINEAKKKLSNPIDFFDWYFKIWNIKNPSFSFTELKQFINENLKIFIKKQNDSFLFSEVIEAEKIERNILKIFSFWDNFHQHNFKNDLKELKEYYIQQLYKNKIQNNVKNKTFIIKNQETFFIKYFPIIDYWLKEKKKILNFLDKEEWFLEIEVLETNNKKQQFINLINLLFFQKNPDYTKISDLVYELQDLSKNFTKITDLTMFFQNYYLYNFEIINMNKKNLKDNLIISFEEKIKLNNLIFKLNKKNTELSKKIHKKLLLL